MNEKELLETLCGLLGSGRLDNSFILPVLKDLGREAGPPRGAAEILEVLAAHPGTSYGGLAAHLRSRRTLEAARCHQRKKSGERDLKEFSDLLGDLPLNVPLGWTTRAEALQKLELARSLLPDRFFLEAWKDRTPGIAGTVEARIREALAGAAGALDPAALIEKLEARADAEALRGTLAELGETIKQRNRRGLEAAEASLAGSGPFPFDLDEEAAAFLLEQAAAPESEPAGKARALDAACAWPTSRMAGLIRKLADEPRLQERAALSMTLRFNERATADWGGCSGWLAQVEELDRQAAPGPQALADAHPDELLLLWTMSRPEIPDPLRGALAEWLRSRTQTLSAPEFAERNRRSLTPEEWNTLTGTAPGAVPAPSAVPRPRPALSSVPVFVRQAPSAAPSAPPPGPSEPSLWDEHVLPFLANNWTMLAGISMVVVGSSLLAFYTWDKHWIVRYTVLPALLAGFTSILARIGTWIEKRDAKLKGTADMLRGAAIALLPANFMAVALLARDPQVPYKELILPAVAVLYVAVFGRALRRWCSAVQPALGTHLARTLLLLNGLVLLGPFALVFDPSGDRIWFLLGAGFHAGFLLTALAIVRFVTTELSAASIEDGRVPWFFGVTLTTTFLQVFLWVHGFMHHVPEVFTYAAMVVAAGGLVLFAEQASFAFRRDAAAHGRDSFIGYALILLGLFMGVSNPAIRLATLLLAGAIWLAQAVLRRDLLHAWIAFTLLLLGGGSVGTWESFPGPGIPALGLGLAAASGAFGRLARRWWDGLEKVGAEMQGAVLSVTTVLAVLVQWHYGSPPLQTAAVLLAAAALFAWRAHRDRNLAYVHTVMAILAISLPYLGFADMSGRTLHGNNVVFGLALLSIFWLALTAARPTPLLRGARSTVLLMYGAAAMAAMCLRVLFEQGRPENLLGTQAAMALGGPVLLGAALLCAAYFSRSLLPIGMAALIGVILFPQLRLEIETWFPFIRWGSGLASSVFAAALALASFALRSAPFLRDLDEGDLFMSRVPFPLPRRDHTLFTTPLLASAFFLAVKVDTWTLASNLVGGGVQLKTAAALCVAGFAWVLFAVYFRSGPNAKEYGHCGWVSAAAGLAFGYYARAADPKWHDALLLSAFALNALFLFYRYGLAVSSPWAEELLAAPLRRALRVLAVVVAAAATLGLVAGVSARDLGPLLIFSTAELCWLGLSDGDALYGGLLFFQSWAALTAWGAPGAAPLFDRLSLAAAATPTFLFLLGIQGAHLLLEPFPEAHRRLKPLISPAFFLAGLGALGVGVLSGFDGLIARSLTAGQRELALAVVWTTARAQASGPLALLGLLLAYLEVLSGALATSGWDARVELLTSPWRLSALAFAMAAVGSAGAALRERWTRLMEGRYAQEFFRMAALPWVHGPSLVFASLAVLDHAAVPALRNSSIQLWTPYLAAAAFAVVGWTRREAWLFAFAALFATLGNIHVVRFFLGEYLRRHGLMENHLLCLGAVASLAQLYAGRLLARRADVHVFLNRAALALAGFVLALLTSTYFVRPNLELMTETRYLLSGLMAYLAGRSFQRAARRPDAGEAPYVEVWEGVYHYGVTTAIWCAALLLPWFRNPYAAFPALSLPVFYFYARAELAPSGDTALVARYRNTAAALAFFMLVLYAFRGAFQMVMFPEAPLGVEHYHFNAPFVMILSVVMFRLQGLGGTSWLGFYGGMAMMVGSYFELTDLPGLSPFEHPIPAAWCAIALGHFWMLFGARPSPPRAFLQSLSGIDDALWNSLQRSWGLFLLAATQFALAFGLADYASNTHMVAPLLLGGASLLAHQGAVRKSPAFFACAGLEALAALHADFFVPSWLTKDGVIWALLGVWAGFLLAAWARPRSALDRAAGPVSLTLGAAVLAHVFYHGPDSTVGLWAFAEMALLWALTPRDSRRAASGAEKLSAQALLAAPVWLAYFSQVLKPYPWPTLTAAAALLATGTAARWVQDRGALLDAGEDRVPRLFDQMLTFLTEEGHDVNSILLYSVFALTASVQVLHYGRPFDVRELALILGLYGGSAAAWYEEGRLRRTMPPYFLLQLCVLGFFAVIRRQLMLTLSFWNYEYDVWASLLVSFTLAGAKQILPLAPREARIPLLGTLLAMPVAVMIWVLIHGLGTNTVLLVVGLYSLMFAYMGKDDRESPYHLVAIGGFVSFILIVFWTKLEVRVVQAYVIPVGLGILTLLQMFKEKIAPAARNDIRAVTLMAMLASAGWYALMDDRYPLAFHMTLLVLAVLVMAVGSFTRVRVYVLLGFGGLLTDLGAILYKVLLHMDRSARMTLIGGQVLVFGALLIGGAIVYKTHQEKLRETLDHWRMRLSSWE